MSVGAEDAAYAVTSRASRASRDEPTVATGLQDTSAAITAHHGKGPDSDATNGLIIDAAPPLAARPDVRVAASGGVNDPGRRHEDDYNLVATPLALRGRGGSTDLESGSPGDPMFALRAGDGGSSRQPLIAHSLTSEGADASEDGTGRVRHWWRTRPVPSSLAVAGDFSTGEGVAQAVRSAHGQPGCVTAGLAVRRLTPLETERLQGLPDNWTRWKLADGQLVEQSDSARYREVGNSVAVPCVAWITCRMAAYDQAAEGREAS